MKAEILSHRKRHIVCVYILLSLVSDERCTLKIKSRIAVAKAVFNNKPVVTSKLDIQRRN